MKTLIVEDDLVSKKLLASKLAKFGTTDEVSTAREAIIVIKSAFILKDPYDLICLDIGLPDAKGIEVMKKLRRIEDAAGVPSKYAARILMITSDNTNSTVLESYREGCDGFLTKPFNFRKLKSWLNKLGLDTCEKN